MIKWQADCGMGWEESDEIKDQCIPYLLLGQYLTVITSHKPYATTRRPTSDFPITSSGHKPLGLSEG